MEALIDSHFEIKIGVRDWFIPNRDRITLRGKLDLEKIPGFDLSRKFKISPRRWGEKGNKISIHKVFGSDTLEKREGVEFTLEGHYLDS